MINSIFDELTDKSNSIVFFDICVGESKSERVYFELFNNIVLRNKIEFNYKQSSFNNISSCISKTRFLIILINSFINDNRNNLKYNEKGNQKNDILLKGIIKIHTETCLREDCPLTKFINNDGNFNVQKQCLLNYMSIYFLYMYILLFQHTVHFHQKH